MANKKKNLLSEKEYQRYIIDYLVKNNKYVERKNADFDRLFAMDREMLFKFLDSSQAETMAALRKIYKEDAEDTIIQVINNSCTSDKGSLVKVLKEGVDIGNGNYHLDLMYTKPATTFNKELTKKYEQNIFSVAEEVYAKDDERIDLVIFLNGLAIMSFELKCNEAGQTYEDAIKQYRTERDPKSRLFLFKAGTLVNFAMDLLEVHMCTKLDKEKTYFLPFNMGNGEGVNAGKGNPLRDDDFPVCYMWKDVLTKDSILELIKKFIFVEKEEKRDEDGKVVKGAKPKEALIFPRYHQRDAIQSLLKDVIEHGSSKNYLIQHSAGSGKTKTIAWLAHRLASQHNNDNKQIFDQVIIITDRIVVDSQLQRAVLSLDHQSGLIKVMDDRCSSTDLANAIDSNTKIVATTIQKFLFTMDKVNNNKKKTFAVIIDEAHSSTSGKDMAAVTLTLSKATIDEDATTEDAIVDEIKRHGKQPNISVFAFTATPKPTTLELFGTLNKKGEKEAFHIYSMKQAIEEGFILDVLQNYTTYNTFYTLNKEIEEDPKCKTNDAKRQIAKYVDLNETNVAQRTEIIIEHFRQYVMSELGGQAKAMVLTKYKDNALAYYKAFKAYIEKKKYSDLNTLVAFSGKVTPEGEYKTYTEVSVNGFAEEQLPGKFDTDEYQILIVANKYQTGFDQKKLCAMYIMKSLTGVNAVQALSRLNRICPPYKKKTFVLDFVNSYEDMQKAFAKYYTTTILSNSVTPSTITEIEAKLDGYYIFDPLDIETGTKLMMKSSITAVEEKQMNFMLGKAEKVLKNRDLEEQREILTTIKHFIRFYEFLLQATCYEDVELHKKYLFVSAFIDYVNISQSGSGYDLRGKVKAINFVQKKDQEHKGENLNCCPVVKLPTAADFGLSRDKEMKLSEIIAEINSRTGNHYDNDITVKSMLQIRDILLKSETLKKSAKNNTIEDFKFTFFDDVDDALIKGLEQNKDFFSLLLENDEMKKQVLGVFANEIYQNLRQSK